MKNDGADGSIQSVMRYGKPALKITKSSSKGFLQIRLKKPMAVGKDKRFAVSGKYSADDVSVDNGLFFRIQNGSSGRIFYNDRLNGGDVYTTFSQPVNTAPGTWYDMLYGFSTEQVKDEGHYLNIILRGSACTVYVTDILCEEMETPRLRFASEKQRKPRETIISEAELDRRLSERRMPQITWKKFPDMMRMYIDGKYMPQLIHRSPPGYPTIARFKEMDNAGIKMHTITILVGGQVGGRSGASIISEKGKYDFTVAFRDIRRLLQAAPDGYVLLNFAFRPFPKWTENNFEEVFRNKKGLYGVSGNLLYVDRWIKNPAEKRPHESFYPSFYAVNWRQECINAVDAFFKEFDKTPMRKTVAGFFVTGGFDGQFMNNQVDYSGASREAFGRYLRKKYGTLEKLRRAWNDPQASWDFPTVGSLPDYPGRRWNETFLDPGKERAYADFMQFRSEGIVDTLNCFADAVRKHMGNDVPGYISICDDLNASHIDTYASVRLSRENRFNGTSCQPAYGKRRNGYAAFNSTVLDSLRIHGKSSVLELDLRTYVTPSDPSLLLRNAVCYAKDIADFRNINRKHAGLQIAKNHGMWYYDMGAGYFYAPEIMEELAITGKVMREVQSEVNTFKPDAAVIFDEKAVFMEQFTSYPKVSFYHGNLMQQYLQTSGVPYDIYFLDDLLEGNVPDYKVLIMLNTTVLSDQQLAKLNKFKSAGRTIIWCYAPGYIHGRKFNVGQVSKVTGMKTIVSDGKIRHGASAVKSADPLAADLESNVGLQETYRFYADYPAGGYGTSWDIHRFGIDDPQAAVLARYDADRVAAVAVRRFKDWTSIYAAGACSVTSQLFNNAVRQAGGFVFSKPGLIAHVRSNFISVHAARGGRYTVKFPVKGKITDAVSGKVYAENGDTLTREFTAGESVWFKIGRP